MDGYFISSSKHIYKCHILIDYNGILITMLEMGGGNI